MTFSRIYFPYCSSIKDVTQSGAWYAGLQNQVDKEKSNEEKIVEQTNTVWFSPVPGIILILVLSVINYMIHTDN